MIFTVDHSGNFKSRVTGKGTSKKIDLEINQVFNEITEYIPCTYDGKSVYPKTLNQAIRIVYAGYENSESMTFKVSDSTITLPGFESEQLKTEFAFDKGKLKISSNHSNSELELTNKQTKKVEKINLKYAEKMTTMRDEMMAKREAGEEIDREGVRTQMQKMREAQTEKGDRRDESARPNNDA